MRLRTKVALVLVILGTAFGLGRCKRPTPGDPTPGVPVALPPEDKEQIVVDPRNHTIVIKRPGETRYAHLPDRPTVIDVHKDGTVKVTSSQWGLEARAFVGVGYSDDARGAIGMDGFYYKRLDVGGGLALNFTGKSPRVFVSISYNIKDNLRLSFTLDHKQNPGVLLSLRV